MNEDMVIKKLLEHDKRFDNIEAQMVTKSDIQEIKTILESIATTVNKIKEDQLFAIEWLKRLQDQIDRQEEDIRKIKLHLQLA